MRVVLASLCLIAFASTADAQEQPATPSVLNEVYACALVPNEQERLACYDGAVGRLRQAETAGDLVAADRTQLDTIERESFGFSLPNLSNIFARRESDSEARAEPPRLTEAEMTIERISQRGDGILTFYMTNGQVWTQTENISARRARPGGAVTIRRATMGSYMMSLDAGGPGLRVRRVQ